MIIPNFENRGMVTLNQTKIEDEIRSELRYTNKNYYQIANDFNVAIEFVKQIDCKRFLEQGLIRSI